MRFLVDANLPRSTVALLARLGHTAEHVRDIGLGDAPDTQIAARAKATGACLITRDLDFADIRAYPPGDYHGLIVLRLSDDAVVATILNTLERFLGEKELVGQIPSHLVIVEQDRARFRPALTP
jgi:predicted nuclease of predicted toxin-antitoxin system